MRLRCGPGSIVDGLTVSGQAQCWQQMARACGVRLWCAAVVCGCGMCGCGVAWTCQRIFCACVKNTAAVHLAIKVSLPCLGVRLSDIRAVHDKLDQLLLLCHTFRRGVQRCNGVESGHARYVAADQHRRAPYSSSAGLNQTARQGHILNIPSLPGGLLSHPQNRCPAASTLPSTLWLACQTGQLLRELLLPHRPAPWVFKFLRFSEIKRQFFNLKP